MDILKYLWCVKVKVKVAQSCQTPWDPMDCSPPGSSVHEILKARTLECVAVPFSRGSSRPRDLTWVSCSAGRLYYLNHQGSPLVSIKVIHSSAYLPLKIVMTLKSYISSV